MAECIERETVNCLLDKFIGYIDEDTIYRIKQKIKCIPTADVQEIRHGEWETEITERGMYIRCSECHFDGLVDEDFSYCPNCGAKMDKE